MSSSSSSSLLELLDDEDPLDFDFDAEDELGADFVFGFVSSVRRRFSESLADEDEEDGADGADLRSV